jgi:hypothetical protein
MAKHTHNLSHREIQAKILGTPAEVPAVDRERVGLVSAGNPDVIREAEGQPANPRLRSGSAWRTGLRAGGGVTHHPNKADGKDIGRRKPITY